jgi:hypothetical protein
MGTDNPPEQYKYPREAAEGVTLPYVTFIPTNAQPSKIPGAGTGLFATNAIQKFTWVGLYPGKVTARVNRKLASHTMGTVRDLYIIADPAVKTGVHMVGLSGGLHGPYGLSSIEPCFDMQSHASEKCQP